MKKNDIFLSHASDDKFVARLVRRYFGSHNLLAWFDESDLKDQGVFDDDQTRAALAEQIEASRVFIILISQASIKKRWVEEEVLIARRLLDEDRIERIVGLILDDTPQETLPDWLQPIRAHELGGVFAKLDVLQDIREQIGEDKPTYISKVEPFFLKQIDSSSLYRNLGKCPPADIDIWFIDGGFSFGAYVVPGLREILTKHPETPIEARVLLMDSAYLRKRPGLLSSAEHRAQQVIDRRIEISKFQTTIGEHHKMVEGSFVEIDRLAREFSNFSCRYYLSDRIAPGRFIFIGDYGFFGPCLSQDDVQLPMFVFDQTSPFFAKVRRSFEEAISDATTREWSGECLYFNR